MKSLQRFVPAALSLFISFVFVQSLFFKFTDSPETLHIFGTLDKWGADSFGVAGLFLPPGPFNAYVIGSAELVAASLLLLGLIGRFRLLSAAGAVMSLGVISGAIFFHLFTPLGVDVQGDGGLLFGLAVGVWIAAAILIGLRREAILAVARGSEMSGAAPTT